MLVQYQQIDNRLKTCDDKMQTRDLLFSVMLMCKESQGKNTDQFVRIVSCAPESMTVLASDWTLNDLDRFCTTEQCSVLCVDPTFSLGEFNITVTTYRHPMLLNDNGKHPVLMGPIYDTQSSRHTTSLHLLWWPSDRLFAT